MVPFSVRMLSREKLRFGGTPQKCYFDFFVPFLLVIDTLTQKYRTYFFEFNIAK